MFLALPVTARHTGGCRPHKCTAGLLALCRLRDAPDLAHARPERRLQEDQQRDCWICWPRRLRGQQRTLPGRCFKLLNHCLSCSGCAACSCPQVIIPSSSSAHFSLSVPVNTLRSATCSLEFDVDAQCLRIMRPVRIAEICPSWSENWLCHCSSQLFGLRNVDPWRRCSYSWVVKPWVTQVECVISRNFAQPIKHHASANAMIISEITFNSSAGESISWQVLTVWKFGGVLSWHCARLEAQLRESGV